MNKTKKTRKGFTIVELTIVIAVIAILAAVLIPTFTGIVKKANLSADKQLVAQMNTIVKAETVVNEKAFLGNDGKVDMEKVQAVLSENGIKIELDNNKNIISDSVLKSGYTLVFKDGQFGIKDDEGNIIYPEPEVCTHEKYSPVNEAPEDDDNADTDKYHYYKCASCGAFIEESEEYNGKIHAYYKSDKHEYGANGECSCGKASEYKTQIVYVAALNEKLTTTYPTMHDTFDAIKGDGTINQVIKGIDNAEGNGNAKILWDQVTQKFVVVTGTTDVVYPAVGRSVEQYQLWDVYNKDNIEYDAAAFREKGKYEITEKYSVYWAGNYDIFTAGKTTSFQAGFDMGEWEPQKTEQVTISIGVNGKNLIVRTVMGETPNDKNWRKIQIEGSSPSVTHHGDFLKVQFTGFGTISYTEYGNVQEAKFDNKTVNLYIETEKTGVLTVDDWTYTQAEETKTVENDNKYSNVTVKKLENSN